MRKFKAVETIHGSITFGKVYEECESYTGNQGCIIIINDSGVRDALYEERFEEVPDTITFASQEEFENAVMEVVLKRLGVQTLTFDKWGRKLTEQYSKSVVYDTLEKL